MPPPCRVDHQALSNMIGSGMLRIRQRSQELEQETFPWVAQTNIPQRVIIIGDEQTLHF